VTRVVDVYPKNMYRNTHYVFLIGCLLIYAISVVIYCLFSETPLNALVLIGISFIGYGILFLLRVCMSVRKR